jgi:NitT/TauT family transport system substrate-binding protein
MKGEKISIISTIQTSNKSNAIVARKDKGILTPGDLKGRKIAVTLGTVREFFMDAFLAVNGISRKDVKVVDLEPAEMAGALAKGEVCRLCCTRPEPYTKAGHKGLHFMVKIYIRILSILSQRRNTHINPHCREGATPAQAGEFVVKTRPSPEGR